MSLQEMKIKLTGETALIMHSDTLANPLHPLTKEMKLVSGKRKKTDEDHILMAKYEFIGGLYHDDEMGLYLPARMLKAVLVEGAKKTKQGTQAKSGVSLSQSKFKLIHDGSNKIEDLWEDPTYRITTSVCVSRARIMRTRPIINQWAVVVGLSFENEILDEANILQFYETAGKAVGIGDWRVSSGGEYGRFSAEVL